MNTPSGPNSPEKKNLGDAIVQYGQNISDSLNDKASQKNITNAEKNKLEAEAERIKNKAKYTEKNTKHLKKIAEAKEKEAKKQKDINDAQKEKNIQDEEANKIADETIKNTDIKTKKTQEQSIANKKLSEEKQNDIKNDKNNRKKEIKENRDQRSTLFKENISGFGGRVTETREGIADTWDKGKNIITTGRTKRRENKIKRAEEQKKQTEKVAEAARIYKESQKIKSDKAEEINNARRYKKVGNRRNEHIKNPGTHNPSKVAGAKLTKAEKAADRAFGVTDRKTTLGKITRIPKVLIGLLPTGIYESRKGLTGRKPSPGSDKKRNLKVAHKKGEKRKATHTQIATLTEKNKKLEEELEKAKKKQAT